MWIMQMKKTTSKAIASLFGKKQTKKTRGAPLCQAIWCCSFLFMYRGKWEVTGRWKRSGYIEDYDSRFVLYCSVHLWASIEHCKSGVCTIHKNCACAKQVIKTIYLIFRKIIYGLYKHGRIYYGAWKFIWK